MITQVLLLLSMALSLGSARAADTPATDLPQRLRASIMDSLPKLGNLEPWQQKIFDDEVMPQYQRFIRDYRNTGAVDVDLDSIRQYLRFYAPKALHLEHPKVLVLLRPESGCDHCQSELASVRALADRRMVRRGVLPLWLGPDEIDRSVTGSALERRLLELAKTRFAQGVLVIEWRLKPVDDIDSAHAEENHYEVKTLLRFPALGDRAGSANGEIDVIENDSIEAAAGRLLTDAMTAMGAELASAPDFVGAGNAQIGVSEVWVEARGFADYTQFAELKRALGERLRAKLGASTSIEERRLTRGTVSFAVFAPRNPAIGPVDAVRLAIADLSVGAMSFSVKEEGAGSGDGK